MSDLKVRFGERVALDLKAAEAARGRVTAVLGPNGAGKSTLLHVLALLLRPTSGRVELLGSTAWAPGFDVTAARRRIGLVMQRPYLFRESVLANVAYPLRRRGVAEGEASSRARTSLDRWGASALADRPAADLSGGETVRVALARATAPDPDVLLLDEASANLDRSCARVLEEAAEDAARRGKVVVLATHDAGFGLRIAGDRIHLRDGRREDAALENVFAGEVAGNRFRTGAAEFDVATALVGPAVATIDPEHVILSAHPLESSARNSFASRVQAMEAIAGGALRVRLAGPLPLVAHVTDRSARDLNLRVGDAVVATFKATGVKVQ